MAKEAVHVSRRRRGRRGGGRDRGGGRRRGRHVSDRRWPVAPVALVLLLPRDEFVEPMLFLLICAASERNPAASQYGTAAPDRKI